MNAEALLTHYERIADAPDAIARLRRFVLDLAVRGKLVPQDANDEPASELLKQIAAEKARLVKAGEARKSEIDPVAENEAPFAVPVKWVWTRLGSIADWGSGSTPARGNPDFYGGGITWLKSGELNDHRTLAGSEETVTQLAIDKGSFRINRPGDVLIAMYGATIGKAAILAENAVTNQAVCGCTPYAGVFNQFLFLFLLSQRAQFHSASEGGAQPNISKVKIVSTPFPLPPLAEQHRIVAKVDELMDLCDRLEAARQTREATRDKLTAASLARLNAPDPDTFQDDARFALDTLSALTARADQIKRLRQTILNLAVRGRLVPQDPTDEPASELVKRIAKELEGARSRRTSQDTSSEDFQKPSQAAPHAIPDSWAWARLDRLANKITDGEHLSPNKTSEGMKLLTAVHVTAGGLSLDNPQFVSLEDGKQFRNRCDPTRGDILVCSRGTIGRCAVVDTVEVFCLMGSVILLRPPSEFSPRYLLAYLSTDAAQSLMKGMSGATAVKALYLKDIRNCPVPVPPLAEQRRIVAKVDELMALCDRLETSLVSTAETRRRLLEALLAETLAPAEDRAMEAAE